MGQISASALSARYAEFSSACRIALLSITGKISIGIYLKPGVDRPRYDFLPSLSFTNLKRLKATKIFRPTSNPKSSMKAFLRQLYRQLTLIVSWCLLTTALTGIIAGLNYRLIQLPDRVVEILISLHQGAFLGDKIAPIYVLLLGLGIFSLGLKVIVEGRYNLLFQSLPPTIANVCRWIVLILLIPLAICVETGVAYRLGTDWLGMSSSETAAFLSVHGGSFSQTLLSIFYLLAATITLITILILSQKHNRIPQKQVRQTLQQEFRTRSAQNSLPNKVLFGRLTVICVLIALLGILYYTTSALLVAIAIMVIITIFSLAILYKKFVEDWQQQKSTSTIPYKQEAESITILKAIPDSMLRISQNGVCLSYMPAKEATSFVLYGNIVNQHISEFLAPEIAGQFMASTRLSLQNWFYKYLSLSDIS